MKGQIQAFRRYRYLLEDLTIKDIKIKYRRSILGILWSVLNPLLMMMVITAVFSTLFRFNIPNYPIYYLTGWVIFNFFSEATNGAMVAVTSAAPLIKKVYIPKYIFPLEKALFALVNMCFSFIAVAIMFLLQGHPLHWTILLFPIPVLYVFFFSVGVGLILSAIAVFFRDIVHLYGVFLTALMYITPILYDDSIIEQSGHYAILTVMRCNPLYYFVYYFRQVVMFGSAPSFRTNIACILMCLASLGLGLLVFKKAQDKFILYI